MPAVAGDRAAAEQTEQTANDCKREVVPVNKDVEKKVAELRSRAKQMMSRHRYTEVVQLLTRAIRLKPQCYKLLKLRSTAYACLGNYQQSLADAVRVLEIMPDSAVAWYQKGFSLYHMMRHVEAAEAFKQGLRLNPADRMLHQGFWDSVTLISQKRCTSGSSVDLDADGIDF